MSVEVLGIAAWVAKTMLGKKHPVGVTRPSGATPLDVIRSETGGETALKARSTYVFYEATHPSMLPYSTPA